VQAAYQTIAEQGLKGLRTRTVAAQVGLTHATLHYYFATKEDLIQAVIDYAIFEKLLAADWTAPYEPQLEGATAAEQLAILLLSLQRRMQDDPSMFLVLNELLRHARQDPAIRELFLRQKIFGNWHTAFAALLREGQAQGQFRSDLDPERAASILMTFLLGLGMTQLVPVPTPAEEMLGELESLLKRPS
jgi:AcrR family transcriptional regulator